MEREFQMKTTTRSLGFHALVAMMISTAFTDNIFRNAIMFLGFRLADAGKAATGLPLSGPAIASMSMILYLMPYAFFSLLAGALADRYSKRSVIIFWKVMEIPLALAGSVGLLLTVGGYPIVGLALSLVMLFGLGAQTAFISPSRYGILPEMLDDDELGHGNGNLDFGSYLGILAGTMSAGLVVEGLFSPDYRWALAALPASAILGTVASTLIPKVAPADPSRSPWVGLDPMRFVHNWKLISARPGLAATVIALTIFWTISTLFILNTPHYAATYLGFAENSIDTMWLVVSISVGLGFGCWAAGRVSMGTIEMGLVPYGAVLWGAVGILMTLTGLFGHVAVESAGGPASVERFWPIAILLGLGGVGAGLFTVPLNAFLEKHSPPEERASCIATANIVMVLGMIAAAVWNWSLATTLGAIPFVADFAPKLVYASGSLALFAVAIYVGWRFPDYFVRFTVAMIAKTLYRIRVDGLENVPKRGPALLVFNHVSYSDGPVIVSCMQRFIRFIVYRTHYNNVGLHWMGVAMKAIPIDAEESPKAIVRALRQATDLLEQGEIVGIFAEGGISRIGIMMPFRRGLEQILKRHPHVPIIPGYIHGLWGSIGSFHRGRFFGKIPEKFRRRVTISFGEPMPGNSTAWQVREQVQLLGARCYDLAKRDRLAMHREFLRKARRNPRMLAVADATTGEMTFGQLLMRSVIFARILKRKLGDERFVGLLVPPSAGGVLANLATFLLRKVPVNLNYTIGVDVINRSMAQSGIKQVVTSKKFVERTKLVPDAELLYLEDLRNEVTTSDKLWGLFARIAPAFVTERVLGLQRDDIDDLATIIFSSGSTGEPKGVMLSHHNVTSNIEGVLQSVDGLHSDTILGILPFFHSFGFTVTLWLPMIYPTSVVYHFNPLEAEQVGKLAHKYKAKIFVATATFLRTYIRKCDKDDFLSIRLLVCGAEKLPTQVADQFENRFQVRPLEGYGCTELSPIVSTSRVNFQQNGISQIGNKNGSIGHPIPGVAVKVVDADTFEPLPVGQEGLLFVKGPNVMMGYLHKPEMTAEAIRDGWYNTGDIAKLDNDGFITITDRMSRFSKIGGEMVPHGKVEDIIHDILGAGERVCAVVGVPDPRKGERLVVIHEALSMPVDKVWEALKEQVPPIWLPSKAAFFQVEELPVLGTGKLDLRGIKRVATERTQDKAKSGLDD